MGFGVFIVFFVSLCFLLCLFYVDDRRATVWENLKPYLFLKLLVTWVSDFKIQISGCNEFAVSFLLLPRTGCESGSYIFIPTVIGSECYFFPR